MAQTYRKNNQRNNQNQQTRQQNAPSIRAKIDRLVDSDGNTKAYASVNVAGAVAIHGIRVMDSRKGLFVSMPNRSYKDSNGNTQYTAILSTATLPTRLQKRCAKLSTSRCLTPIIRRWQKVKTTALPKLRTTTCRLMRMRTAVWALPRLCKKVSDSVWTSQNREDILLVERGMTYEKVSSHLSHLNGSKQS